MASPQQISRLNLNSLILDLDNPRLPLKIRKQQDEAVINWMLLDASIIELMLAIGQSDFFIGEALLVVEDGAGKFKVIEGNRRLTALKVLSNPEIATVQKNKVAKVLQEVTFHPTEIPCIIFDSRNEITKYLGYRHVTGIKSWGVLAKARYLTEMFESESGDDFVLKCRSLAKSIGSRSDYVKKLIVAYKIYEEIEDTAFFSISNLNETTFHFNYLSDSLSRKNIRSYVGLDSDYDANLNGLDRTKLETLVKWFFEKNDGVVRVLGTSSDLKKLDEILGDADARLNFEEGGGNITSAYEVFHASADSFHREILLAINALKRAGSYEHHIENHHETDVASLRDVMNLCRSLKAAIESKKLDDDDF